MSLLQALQTAQLKARKEKDQVTLGTIQMVLSQVKNEQINLMKKEMSEEEIVGVIRKFIKQLKDALGDFEKAGREDLVLNAKREIELMEQYLPQQMNEADVEAAVVKAIGEMGQVTEKDFGKVMSRAMKETGGRADGALVQQIVKRLLSTG